MAIKYIDVEDIGNVSFQKHSLARGVKIRINGPSVKVTLPPWVPYKAAVAYVNSKKEWILRHKTDKHTLKHNDAIGKYHILLIQRTGANRFNTQITNKNIVVNVPQKLYIESDYVQKKLQSIVEKALTEQTELLLPDKVEQLAKQFNFTFSDLRFKKLKGRWGSCDTKKVLTFNTYLIQLPWDCIDYVIIHELAHTEHLNHSSAFWNRVEMCFPNAKAARRKLKTFSPDIISTMA